VTSTPPGYFELLRRRPAFRAIWLGSVVSLAGDWFTLIALYSLLEQYTGRSEAIGLMLLVRFVPLAVISPMAGVVADRFSRKRIMVTADLLRAVVVLGFLLVRSAEHVWLVYALTFLQMSLASFFDPAEAAAIGSAVEQDEVVTANTLQGATWSAMLGFGAVFGGILTALAGREASFVVDALSYLLSAFFISRATLRMPEQPARASTWMARLGFDDLFEGFKLVRQSPDVRRVLWVKSSWSLAGGAALVLYAVMGSRIFAIAGSPEAGVGVLLAMRGAGAFFGPLIARRIGGDGPAFLERAIGLAFLVTAVAWLAFALAPNLPLAAVCLAIAHTGVSTQWVFSTSLINLRVEDRFRGRVFAVDTMLSLIALAASSWFGGKLLDELKMEPRRLMMWLSLITAGAAIGWWWLRRDRALDAAAKQPSA
jgi:predicted MFS family arabinose efflux permease